MPAKKKTKKVEIAAKEMDTGSVLSTLILPIVQDFAREDLHILRDKINEIIVVLNAKVNA